MKYIKEFLRMDLLEAAIYVPIIGIPLKIAQYIAIPLLVFSLIIFITENLRAIGMTILKVGLIILSIVLIIKVMKKLLKRNNTNK